MLKTFTLAVLVIALLPASAAANDQLTRGMFGSGAVLASSTPPRPPAPGCAAPSNAADRLFTCPAIAAAGFGRCSNLSGGSGFCDITVTAQPAVGWRFDRWSGGRCSGTNPVCTFRTTERICSSGPEPECTTNEFGPWMVIAHFAEVKVTFDAAPSNDSVVISENRQQAFVFSVNASAALLCRRDGGSFAACTSPHLWTGIADGLHDFCVRPADATVNACVRWQQEASPSATIVTHPPDVTEQTTAEFTYTSNKASHPADGSTLTYECRLDGGFFEPCAGSGKTYIGLANGTHTFSVRAIFHAALDAPGVNHTVVSSYDWKLVDTPTC